MEYLNLKTIEHLESTIISEGKHYYLHSDGDFIGFFYDVILKDMYLIWRYPSDYFINDNFDKKSKKYLELYDIPFDKRQRLISLEFSNIKSFYYNKVSGEVNPDSDFLSFDFYDDVGDEVPFRLEFMSETYINIDAESVYFNRDFKAEKILELLSLKLKL